MSLNDIITQFFQMTPAGTPPLIEIKDARTRAANCIAKTLEEACKRQCRLCEQGIEVKLVGSAWSHGKDPCEASDLRGLMSELN